MARAAHHLARRFSQRLAAFRRDENGNATIEFVVLFPVLMYILLSMGEAGAMMARSVMLERGLDIAMRDLRLGLATDRDADGDFDHDDMKILVCDGAFLIGDCRTALLLEVVPMDDPTGLPVGAANCIDRRPEALDPVIRFEPGVPSQIMIVRACVVLDPVFPGAGLGALLPVDESGGYSIVTQSAFTNEPI